jgi:hypothetical protein
MARDWIGCVVRAATLTPLQRTGKMMGVATRSARGSTSFSFVQKPSIVGDFEMFRRASFGIVSNHSP